RLRNANAENLPTYPSSMPTLPLDFVLYSRGIVVDEFRVPRVRFSDHLPVVCDFRVLPRGEGRTP
ncbi:MAG TPA: endonuclease, partial [Synergistaceae bacterium]|nr:endonuclease [Synergistaceae bacterium]